jgi:hypothetical protein
MQIKLARRRLAWLVNYKRQFILGNEGQHHIDLDWSGDEPITGDVWLSDDPEVPATLRVLSFDRNYDWNDAVNRVIEELAKRGINVEEVEALFDEEPDEFDGSDDFDMFGEPVEGKVSADATGVLLTPEQRRDLKLQVFDLAQTFDAEIYWDPSREITPQVKIYNDFNDDHQITLWPINTDFDYFAALHELGHLAFRMQYSRVYWPTSLNQYPFSQEEELYAWHWALEAAQIPISPSSLEEAKRWFSTYQDAPVPSPAPIKPNWIHSRVTTLPVKIERVNSAAYGNESHTWENMREAFVYDPLSNTIYIGSPGYHHAELLTALYKDHDVGRDLDDYNEDYEALTGVIVPGYYGSGVYYWFGEVPDAVVQAFKQAYPDLRQIAYDGTEMKAAKVATKVVNIAEVDPEDMYDRTTRHPFIYDNSTDTLYIGPFGSHHLELLSAAFPGWMDNEELEQKVYELSEIGEAIGDNYGIILPNRKQIYYFGDPDQYPRMRSALLQQYPGYTEETQDAGYMPLKSLSKVTKAFDVLDPKEQQELTQHIEELADLMNAGIKYEARPLRVSPAEWKAQFNWDGNVDIYISRITTPIEYFAALHELGHIAFRLQHHKLTPDLGLDPDATNFQANQEEELYAWHWALETSKIPLDIETLEQAREYFQGYVVDPYVLLKSPYNPNWIQSKESWLPFKKPVLPPESQKELTDQVHQLADLMNVSVVWDGIRWENYINHFADGGLEAHLTPITTEIDYFVALHELGHAAFRIRYQKLHPDLTVSLPVDPSGSEEEELYAWHYALEVSKIPFSEATLTKAHKMFQTYVDAPDIPQKSLYNPNWIQSKTGKIVDLPELSDHSYISQPEKSRRTFVYIPENDTLYLAPNNAYHNDIFHHLIEHGVAGNDWETSVSGLIEPAFNEYPTTVYYYAHIGDKLPDHILTELEQRFGPIYQEPFNVPVDWRTVDDQPEPEPDPTQQWPEDARQSSSPVTFVHVDSAEYGGMWDEWENGRIDFFFDETTNTVYLGSPGEHHQPLFAALIENGLIPRDRDYYGDNGNMLAGYVVDQPHEQYAGSHELQGVHYWGEPPSELVQGFKQEYPDLPQFYMGEKIAHTDATIQEVLKAPDHMAKFIAAPSINTLKVWFDGEYGDPYDKEDYSEILAHAEVLLPLFDKHPDLPVAAGLVGYEKLWIWYNTTDLTYDELQAWMKLPSDIPIEADNDFTPDEHVGPWRGPKKSRWQIKTAANVIVVPVPGFDTKDRDPIPAIYIQDTKTLYVSDRHGRHYELVAEMMHLYPEIARGAADDILNSSIAIEIEIYTNGSCDAEIQAVHRFTEADTNDLDDLVEGLRQAFPTLETVYNYNNAASKGAIVWRKTAELEEIRSPDWPFDWNWYTSWIYIPETDELLIKNQRHINHHQLFADSPIKTQEIYDGNLGVMPGLILAHNDNRERLGVYFLYSDTFSGSPALDNSSGVQQRAMTKIQEWANALHQSLLSPQIHPSTHLYDPLAIYDTTTQLLWSLMTSLTLLSRHLRINMGGVLFHLRH